MYKIKLYTFLLVFAIIIGSCSKENFEATIPAYISIPSITLTTDYATEGTSSSNITDAWVFVDDDLVGVYELPASFPVLKEGDVSVKVFAGIRDNGISASRARYLLYDPHVEQLKLVPGETNEIVADVRYNTNAKFTWLEDFESASTSFLYHDRSDTIFKKQSTVVKEGQFSGQIYLEDEMDFFEATSFPYTDLPAGGALYLEMDFITNENLLIGLYLDDEQFAHITLNTNEDWKKIYINLEDAAINRVNAQEVRIFIGMKEESNFFINSHPEVFIDNIKLVHF